MLHVLQGHQAQQPAEEILPLHLWDLVEQCWAEDSHARPTASKVIKYCSKALMQRLGLQESPVSDDELHILQTLASSGQFSLYPLKSPNNGC